jgi:DNA polymerase III subunit epsilon
MRQIVLDTETTGLNARQGDRIIEIGGIELVNRRPTGNHFHCYLNPERAVDAGALKVHGLTDEFLADKPRFADVAGELLAYLRGAELVIHNAAFDVEFLNEELARIESGPLAEHVAGVLDTLAFARELHPGKKNSLDALCERYQIDNSHRTLHGALLDAQLLAEVYLAMTRGQETLAIEIDEPRAVAATVRRVERVSAALLVIRATDEETAAHDAILRGIDQDTRGRCVWSTA